jgi:hypothetical protein
MSGLPHSGRAGLRNGSIEAPRFGFLPTLPAIEFPLVLFRGTHFETFTNASDNGVSVLNENLRFPASNPVFGSGYF